MVDTEPVLFFFAFHVYESWSVILPQYLDKKASDYFFYLSGNKDPISRPQIFLFIPLHFLYSMYKNFKNKNNTNKNVIKMMYLSLILQSKSRNYTLLYLFAPKNPWPNCTQDSCHWQRCLSILTVC